MRHILLLFCCVSASCGMAAPGAAAPGAAAQIQQLIGPAPCSAHAQCHSMAFGAKACGGPERYLAWSSAHTRQEQLDTLARRLRAERQAQLLASGEVSNCLVAIDPGAQCVAGHCVPGKGNIDPR